MKTFSSILILLILPILFMIMSFQYRSSMGAFIYANFYDPSYSYLINSLNLSQSNGYGVGIIDHPATPVFVVGAIVIKFFHSINGSNSDIVKDVFSRPEYYLHNISLVFVIMIAIALFTLGYVSFKKSKSIMAGVILQLTPFYASVIYYQLANVSAEPLLIFSIVCLITVIVGFINEENMTTKNSLKYIIIFGIVCGLGMASKLSFFPLCIIPIVLIKPAYFKGLFLIITITAFLIFIYPAFSLDNAIKFSAWVKSIITHSDKYGRGSEYVINASKFLPNLKVIFFREYIFGVMFIMIFITLLLQFIPRFKNPIRSNKYFKLLIGIFITMIVQIIIVAKHFEMHYMIPGFMFSVMGLFVVNSIIGDLFPKYGKKKYIYLSVILGVFLYFQLKTIINENKYFIERRNDSYNTVKYIQDNYQDLVIVSTYGSSSKEFALYYGVYWAGSQEKTYSGILKEMFPNKISYDIWTNDFYAMLESEYIKSKLINSNRFIFQCESKEVLNGFMQRLKQFTNKPNANYKNLFKNNRGESIYEITLDPF